MTRILFTMQDVESGWAEFAGGGVKTGLAQIRSGAKSVAGGIASATRVASGAGKDFTVATSKRGLKFIRKVGKGGLRRSGLLTARGIGLAGKGAGMAGAGLGVASERLGSLAKIAAANPGRTGAIAAGLGAAAAGSAYLANRNRRKK